jgi:hypothetical protein
MNGSSGAKPHAFKKLAWRYAAARQVSDFDTETLKQAQ